MVGGTTKRTLTKEVGYRNHSVYIYSGLIENVVVADTDAAGGDTMKALVGNPRPDMLHQCKLLPSYCRLKFTNLASF